MGKENDVMLSYLGDNERFADLFNYCYFGGKRVVKPQELEEASEVYSAYRVNKPDADGVYNRIRDIKKRLKSGKELKILALESQSMVNYTMPWRCMDYDCREYDKQIREIQRANRRMEQRGAEEGNGKLPIPSDTAEDDALWEKYFTDYPMRLICVNEIEDCTAFQSSLGELFSLLPYRNNKKKLKELMQAEPRYQNVDSETAEAISVLMGVETFMEKKEKYENGEGYNMCQALREMMEDSRMEGIQEGREQGIRVLVETCKEVGLTREEILVKVKDKYELEQNVAEQYLLKFLL